MNKVKKIICIIVAYLPVPSNVRAFLYSFFPGYEISNDVKCNYGCVINVEKLKIGKGTIIGRHVRINSLSKF